ncbi:GAF domain-containing protein [Nocardia sp. NBC_01388]|uniref:GAF domain-containing protein n=1 Tax=Nocardia sp. NBC_01388 TaxID=2903596 RepID=UPI00324EAEF9
MEMLTPEIMSVASVGSSPRDFAGWQRVLQRQLAKTPAIYHGMKTADIAEAIWSAHNRAQDGDLTVPTKAGPYSVLTRPVLGPAGDVHAIRFWAGPSAAPIPAPPTAIGAIWDLDSQTVALPSGITRLTGSSAEEYAPRMSIAELFHRVSGFDRHAEVLDLLYEPKQGGKLQFDATIADGAQRPGRWRFTLRSRDDERCCGAWLLIEDITPDHIQAPYPALESVGLREAHRRAGTCLAMIQLERTSISHWLTDPAPWVRWDYLFRPRDVFHPDDRERLVAASARLRAGETVGVTVRALNYGGSYTPTSLLIFPYPGFSGQQLAIAQFVRVAEDFSMPESVQSVSDRPGCSPPFGYDEQLRHRLRGRMDRGALC